MIDWLGLRCMDIVGGGGRGVKRVLGVTSGRSARDGSVARSKIGWTNLDGREA